MLVQRGKNEGMRIGMRLWFGRYRRGGIFYRQGDDILGGGHRFS